MVFIEEYRYVNENHITFRRNSSRIRRKMMQGSKLAKRKAHEMISCAHCGGDHYSNFCDERLEVIIRAAIRTPDGHSWSMPTPARHHDLIRMLSSCGYGPAELSDQGFRTNKREFVDRIEGLKVATAAGQIREKHGNANELFSEDLW